MKKTLGWLVLVILFAATALGAQGVTWRLLPGEARDIAIGGSGGFLNGDVVWMVEKAMADIRYGGWVCRWDEKTESWVRVSGIAESVTVTPKGVCWVVNGEGKIFEWSNNHFVERPGYGPRMLARDIGVGKSRYVHIISNLNGHIYYWTGAIWKLKSEFKNKGVARRIDIDVNGNPWVVTVDNIIYQYVKGRWQDMSTIPGKYALDIGADMTSTDIWITADDQLPEGGHLYYTVISNVDWYGSMSEPNMVAARIDLLDGMILVATASGQIWWGTMW